MVGEQKCNSGRTKWLQSPTKLYGSLFVLYNLVKNRMLKKEETFCCYIDTCKAFDTVDRTCLEFKLMSKGIKGKIYNAINSLYDNYGCTIRLNESFS